MEKGKVGNRKELEKGSLGGKWEDCEGNGKVERERERLKWKDKNRD